MGNLKHNVLRPRWPTYNPYHAAIRPGFNSPRRKPPPSSMKTSIDDLVKEQCNEGLAVQFPFVTSVGNGGYYRSSHYRFIEFSRLFSRTNSMALQTDSYKIFPAFALVAPPNLTLKWTKITWPLSRAKGYTEAYYISAGQLLTTLYHRQHYWNTLSVIQHELWGSNGHFDVSDSEKVSDSGLNGFRLTGHIAVGSGMPERLV